jgi:hypothetical protein
MHMKKAWWSARIEPVLTAHYVIVSGMKRTMRYPDRLTNVKVKCIATDARG